MRASSSDIWKLEYMIPAAEALHKHGAANPTAAGSPPSPDETKSIQPTSDVIMTPMTWIAGCYCIIMISLLLFVIASNKRHRTMYLNRAKEWFDATAEIPGDSCIAGMFAITGNLNTRMKDELHGIDKKLSAFFIGTQEGLKRD